jgi:hypothetical protein
MKELMEVSKKGKGGKQCLPIPSLNFFWHEQTKWSNSTKFYKRSSFVDFKGLHAYAIIYN